MGSETSQGVAEMKSNPQQFSFPPLHDESQIMPQGFYGAFLALVAYVFLITACFAIALYLRHGMRISALLLLSMNLVFVVLLVGGYFFIVGIFNHWVFLLIDDLTGKVIDLRVMSVVAPCSLVYTTVVFFYVNFGYHPAGFDLREVPISGVIFFLFFPLVFVSVGAWIKADKRYRQCKTITPRVGRFELKYIFGATLVFAVLLSLSKLAGFSILFWIGFPLVMVPVSLTAAVVVWIFNLAGKRGKFEAQEHRLV